MAVSVTTEMRHLIASQRLCFVATVTPDGKPNLSPKGSIRVWDDHHLFFLDIASPGTRENLAANPWIELNVVDPLSRMGFRFLGRATLHRQGPVYDEARDRILQDEGLAQPAEAVVLIEIERAERLVSPVYRHVRDEARVRRIWRERRAGFEAEYELFLRAIRPDRHLSVLMNGNGNGHGVAAAGPVNLPSAS
jgi:predicted pyridoxine 5'-phosphate oxidase superfamily flavin-nucleotide-binding protein